MIDEGIDELPTLAWMASRIPVRDALATIVPKGVEFPKDLIPPSHEQRWYPQEDGSLRLLVPYDGGTFDSALFQIVPAAWNHTHCDLCNAQIAAMTLCYVTRVDPYIALCADCYVKHVVNRYGVFRQLVWRVKQIAGLEGEA